jgi:hypothetical protein
MIINNIINIIFQNFEKKSYIACLPEQSKGSDLKSFVHRNRDFKSHSMQIFSFYL